MCLTNMESASQGGGIQAIFKLSTRPQVIISHKHDETIELEPETLQTLVFISKCTKCRMILKKKPVKVVIENCQDLVLILCSELVSGTLEIIKSANIAINVEDGIKISTITADSTQGLCITLQKDEKQLGSLYSHQSSNLAIEIGKGEERREFPVIRQANDPEYFQFISHWEEVEGRVTLVTEKVVRDGAYPYTEKTLHEAREKDRKNAEKAMAFLEEKFFKPKDK